MVCFELLIQDRSYTYNISEIISVLNGRFTINSPSLLTIGFWERDNLQVNSYFTLAFDCLANDVPSFFLLLIGMVTTGSV